MARSASEHPTELELLILKVLWRESPLPVRDIRRALARAGRDLAHTTVITTLNVMVRKKFVKRTMEGKACLFAPRVTREQVSTRMLGDIVERVFDGSAAAVVLNLFDRADLKADELRELRQILRQKTQEKSP
ncbi:MAG: BlaI/MecI/CopY family transcriptional regulator [Deltaproteobacteria bacterium]